MKKGILTSGLAFAISICSAQGPAFWDRGGNNNISAADFLGHSNNVPLTIKTTTAQPIILRTGNVEGVRILGDNQFVGIGNANPLHRLSVAGAIAFNSHLVSRTANAYLNWGSGGAGNLYFRTLSNAEQLISYTDRMIIANNGYVEIGDQAPNAKLQINSAIERESFRIYLNGSNNYLSMYQGTGAGVIDPIGTGKLYLGYDPATDVYIGGNNNGVNPYSKLGIGTNNPTGFLNIKTPDVAWHGFLLEHNSTVANTAHEIRVKNDDSRAMLISNWVNSPYDAFKVFGNGRTVIGKSTPANISSGPNVQLGVFQNSPIGIGQCIELRSNATNAINTLLIVDRDDEYGIQLNKYTNAGYINNFSVKGNGQTAIGCADPGNYMLAVNGKVAAREIKVTIQNPWPDYVFEQGYELKSLDEIEKFVKQNKHLPNVPAASEIKCNEFGLDVAEMQSMQMEKIEELYLHLINIKNELEKLKEENKSLKTELNKK